jgi:hypothetical protein
MEDGLLGFLRREQGAVIVREDFFEFVVIADAGTGQVGSFVEYSRHETSPLWDAVKAGAEMRTAVRHPNAVIDGFSRL